MHPENLQEASAVFYSSDGCLARSTDPVYNKGMFSEGNHLQNTREGVAQEQQPLVTVCLTLLT